MLSTLKNRLEDLVLGLPRPTAGLMDQLTRFRNQRLERLLAHAVTVKLFEDTVLPRIQEGTVRHYHQIHLTETAEERDSTCRPILGYGRSLLSGLGVVRRRGQDPVPGMEQFFTQSIGGLNLQNVRAWSAPSAASASTTHGGFDDDETTMRSVISIIRTGKLPARPTARPSLNPAQKIPHRQDAKRIQVRHRGPAVSSPEMAG